MSYFLILQNTCDYKYMVKKKQIKSAISKAKDLAAAKTDYRRKRKRENQRRGQNSSSDLHHTSDGRIVRTSIAYNRNTWGRGERRRKRGKKKRAIA